MCRRIAARDRISKGIAQAAERRGDLFRHILDCILDLLNGVRRSQVQRSAASSGTAVLPGEIRWLDGIVALRLLVRPLHVGAASTANSLV